MIVSKTVDDIRKHLQGDVKVGFVPTMGALHLGHKQLLDESRKVCQVSVASIFVNPTQFGPGEDFEKYPQTLDSDLDLCKSAGVDVVFLPTASEMYKDMLTNVSVTGVSEAYEGKFRPGHFDGVATVVLKLFNIVQPSQAFFGLKDLQQCAVIRKMVSDLGLSIQLSFVETVRLPSGLAMSSRNKYFSEPERESASFFYKSLSRAAKQIISKQETAEIALEECTNELTIRKFSVDYIDLVDPETMKPVYQITESLRIVGAVKYANVRLIDNVPLAPA